MSPLKPPLEPHSYRGLVFLKPAPWLDAILRTIEHNRDLTMPTTKALHDFIENKQWQIQEIKDAIKEADAGEFASDKEVRMTFAKWGAHTN